MTMIITTGKTGPIYLGFLFLCSLFYKFYTEWTFKPNSVIFCYFIIAEKVFGPSSKNVEFDLVGIVMT